MPGVLDRLIELIKCNYIVRAAFNQEDKFNIFFIEKTQLDKGEIDFAGLRKQLQDKLCLFDDQCL